jgi:hypothetical protein
MEVAHEPSMVQGVMVSEIGEHPPHNGARVAQHKDHRMEVQDHQDVNFKNDHLLNVLLRLLNRIINGVRR